MIKQVKNIAWKLESFHQNVVLPVYPLNKVQSKKAKHCGKHEYAKSASDAASKIS